MVQLLWLNSKPALATQDLLYGLGGATTSRVGSITADPQNPYAGLYNPALLGMEPGRLFSFSTSMAGAQFSPLGNVRLDSPDFRTATGTQRDGVAQLPNFKTTLWSLGYRHTFEVPFMQNRLAGLGLVFSGPMAGLRNFSTPTAYDFSTLRYGTSDTQFKATGSLGLELFPKTLSLGLGTTVFVSSSGIADTVIGAENPTARMKMVMAMNTSFVTGLFAKVNSWNAAFVYRQQIKPQFAQSLEGQVDFAGARVLNQPMQVETTLYFEPHMFELEWQGKIRSITVSGGLSYQLWSQYEPSYMRVSSPARNGQARATRAPMIPFKNTLSPRVSMILPLAQDHWTLSAGYQYRPSPIEDISGLGNLLDSNTHVVGLGVGCRVAEKILGSEYLNLNLTGQLHFMEKRDVQKAAPDLIGAPGYQFKGNAYVIGVSADLAI